MGMFHLIRLTHFFFEVLCVLHLLWNLHITNLIVLINLFTEINAMLCTLEMPFWISSEIVAPLNDIWLSTAVFIFYLVLKIEVSFLIRTGISKITLALHIGEKFLNALVLISVLLFFYLGREVVVPGNFIELFRRSRFRRKFVFLILEFSSWN